VLAALLQQRRGLVLTEAARARGPPKAARAFLLPSEGGPCRGPKGRPRPNSITWKLRTLFATDASFNI